MINAHAIKNYSNTFRINIYKGCEAASQFNISKLKNVLPRSKYPRYSVSSIQQI